MAHSRSSPSFRGDDDDGGGDDDDGGGDDDDDGESDDDGDGDGDDDEKRGCPCPLLKFLTKPEITHTRGWSKLS